MNLQNQIEEQQIEDQQIEDSLQTTPLPRKRGRKPGSRSRRQIERTLESFVLDFLRKDKEQVKEEISFLKEAIERLDLLVLNLKLKIRYNELHLCLEEYKNKVSLLEYDPRIVPDSKTQDPRLQMYGYSGFNATPNPFTNDTAATNPTPDLSNLKLPNLNPDGNITTPDGNVFTSTPIIM